MLLFELPLCVSFLDYRCSTNLFDTFQGLKTGSDIVVYSLNIFALLQNLRFLFIFSYILNTISLCYKIGRHLKNSLNYLQVNTGRCIGSHFERMCSPGLIEI